MYRSVTYKVSLKIGYCSEVVKHMHTDCSYTCANSSIHQASIKFGFEGMSEVEFLGPSCDRDEQMRSFQFPHICQKGQHGLVGICFVVNTGKLQANKHKHTLHVSIHLINTPPSLPRTITNEQHRCQCCGEGSPSLPPWITRWH